MQELLVDQAIASFAVLEEHHCLAVIGESHQPRLARPQLRVRALALHRGRHYARDCLQEFGVAGHETPARRAVRAEHAVGSFPARDHDAHTAADAVFVQHAGPREAVLARQVLDHGGAPRLVCRLGRQVARIERVAEDRVGAQRHGSVAYHSRLPAGAGDKLERVALGQQLQYPDKFGLQQVADHRRRAFQHRLKAGFAKRKQAELGERALALEHGRNQPLALALPVPRRHVARQLGEAAQPAACVAQRRDHHVGPEAAAVLAHAPAFGVEAAFALCAVEALLRLAGVTVLGRIEQRDRPADDLACAVALDALRALVPAEDAPAAVDQEDRVVRDALHQQPELLVGGVRPGGKLLG